MRTAKMGPDHRSDFKSNSIQTRGAKHKQGQFFKADFSCNFVSISHDLNLVKNAKKTRENDPFRTVVEYI